MSKKKKFRLHANQKAEILRQLQQKSTITASITPLEQPTTIASPVNNVLQKKTLYRPITPVEDVRNDIKKIGVVVGILVVLLVVSFIIDKKYNYSLAIGQKITQELGI